MTFLLLVEDDPYLAEVLQEFFTQEGFHVRYATDGINALAEIGRTTPDVILADAMMPRLGGLGLIASLKARGLQIPFVLMSANYVDPDQPGVRFVHKPFDLDELLGTVSSAIDSAA